MLRRGLAFGMTLMIASVVQAGATITLVPKGNLDGVENFGPYPEGSNISLLVDVLLTQDGGGADSALRFIQVDLSNSSPELFPCQNDGCISPPTTHPQACPNGAPGAGTVFFWEFGGVPLCDGDSTSCACGHFLEQRLNGPRPRVMSSTYYFTDPGNLGQNTNAQRVLRADQTPLLIGTLFVQTPSTAGTYTLDLMNAGETNPDLGGADVRFGFGVNINGQALTSWRAGSGLSGGTLDLCVGTPEQCGGDPCPNFVSATPACDSSLPRSEGNVMRINYDGPVPPEGCSGLEIVELDAAGADAGPNLAGSFTCSTDGPNTLHLAENGTAMANGTWYRVTSCGTTVVYRSLKGDANNDGINDFGDLSFIFVSNNQPPVGDGDPNDINNDGLIDFGDLSAAFSFSATQTAGPRPSGPACP